jgi:L-methionine (R)-S-oxide reductase
LDYFFLFLVMHSQRIKKARYYRLGIQLGNLLADSPSVVSQLATVNALLYHKIQYVFWVGFYILDKDDLIIGPYQGPLACQKLKYPNGACWHTIIHNSCTLIPDVHKFPGHIACDPRSKSELVIPVYLPDKTIYGVLDLDSDKLNAFDDIDAEEVQRFTTMIRFSKQT